MKIRSTVIFSSYGAGRVYIYNRTNEQPTLETFFQKIGSHGWSTALSANGKTLAVGAITSHGSRGRVDFQRRTFQIMIIR